MANRPTRPWLRLASISSLGPTPAPTPAPPPPSPPAPAPVQPTFRPLAIQPQEPPPPPPPPSAPAPAPAPKPIAAEPTQTQNGERNAPPPQPVVPPRSVTSSIPSLPINGRSTTTTTRTTSSLPTSPTPKIPSPPPKKEETIPPAPPPSRSPPPPPSPAPPAPAQTSPEIKPIQPSPGAFKLVHPKKTSSPRIAPQAPPPSPLTLPPSQFQDHKEQNQQFEHKIPEDAEQKTVTEVQNSKSRTVPMPPMDDNSRKIKHHEAMHKEKSLSHHHHQYPGHKVITIAGENKGAVMELIRSPTTATIGKGDHHHPPTASGPPHFLHEKSSGKESKSESSSENEEKQKQKQHLMKNHKFGKALSHSPPTNAFMNSNVQGINNSIVYNSSCTHNDPGVHLSLSRKPTWKGGGFKVSNNGKGDH